MGTFDHQDPNPEQIAKINEVRKACGALYEVFNSLPDSRQKSLAITKLEEAAMWANKGIVSN